jgi:hypothetical protein
MTSNEVETWRAQQGSYVPPGGRGAPEEINTALNRIKQVIIRTYAGENGYATRQDREYDAKSKCFASSVHKAISERSEEKLREIIPEIERCGLNNVKVRWRTTRP